MPQESITLYYREGSSDKIYQAEIVEKDGGHLVNFTFGRRGSTLQSGTKTHTPVSFDNAKKIYDNLVREKTLEGYTSGASGTPYIGTDNADRITGIIPQLLNPIDDAQVAELIADRNHWMQEKKDGRRVLIQTTDKIVGINRKGMTIGLSEVIEKSAAEIEQTFLMDGEAVGDTYHAFDLLKLNGTSLRDQGYRERFEALSLLLKKKTGSIELVPAYTSANKKREAFDRLKAANAEGVVFKRADAPYKPGRPSSGGAHLKFKFVATGTFRVAAANMGKRSVGLEALNEVGQSQYVGNVTIPANHEIPSKGDLVEVRYLYAFREGCLFQPIYLGTRDDIEERNCTTTQLKFRPEENDDE